MTASLRIALETRPLERVPARLALAGVFEDERPLRGAAGRADWRLCGLLTELLLEGSMTGGLGEATLVGTSGRLASDALLVIGLGARRAYGAGAYERAIRTGFERVAGLAAPSVVVGSFGLETEQLVAHSGVFIDGALAGLGGASVSVLLCIVEAEEGRMRRELVRCGRSASVEIASMGPLREREERAPGAGAAVR
jgi:hypothetical protein